MRQSLIIALALALVCPALVADEAAEKSPKIASMSALTFAPGGVLVIGDSLGAKVFSVATGDTEASEAERPPRLTDIETKIAALLGARASEILIHDLATNPASGAIFLSVSRSRSRWESGWQLPNDLGPAEVLLRIDADGSIDEFSLDGLEISSADLPNPVDESKTHMWKTGQSLRVDVVTDLAIDGDALWVSGLSNEEFSSSLWRLDWPLAEDGETAATTVEIFHGAHGEWETHAPIRSFLPYELSGSKHILASYLCTPLVTFDQTELVDGAHLKGRTVAEFGSGNFPVDMVAYEIEGERRVLIANSQLPFMIVKATDIEAFEGEINTEVEGYVGGVSWEPRSGAGVQQMDRWGSDYLVAIQRLPGGTLDLMALPMARF